MNTKMPNKIKCTQQHRDEGWSQLHKTFLVRWTNDWIETVGSHGDKLMATLVFVQRNEQNQLKNNIQWIFHCKCECDTKIILTINQTTAIRTTYDFKCELYAFDIHVDYVDICTMYTRLTHERTRNQINECHRMNFCVCCNCISVPMSFTVFFCSL